MIFADSCEKAHEILDCFVALRGLASRKDGDFASFTRGCELLHSVYYTQPRRCVVLCFGLAMECRWYIV